MSNAGKQDYSVLEECTRFTVIPGAKTSMGLRGKHRSVELKGCLVT